MAAFCRKTLPSIWRPAIYLANRRVHLRFLDEAELLLTFDLPAAAVLVAGVVLEALLAGSLGQVGSEDRQRMRKWSELRNSIAHAKAPVASLDQTKEMVKDVRACLTREARPGPHLAPARASAGFIRRKADELSLEHDERSH